MARLPILMGNIRFTVPKQPGVPPHRSFRFGRATPRADSCGVRRGSSRNGSFMPYARLAPIRANHLVTPRGDGPFIGGSGHMGATLQVPM